MSTSDVPTTSFFAGAKLIELRSNDACRVSYTGTPDTRQLFQFEDSSRNESPVSQLTRNLEDLSTSRQLVMPRRKLSLNSCTPGNMSSFNSPSSVKLSLSKQLSVDEGCSVDDSPGVDDGVESPFIIQHRFGNLDTSYGSQGHDDSWAENRPKMKKFKTLPLTFYGFGSPSCGPVSCKSNVAMSGKSGDPKTDNDGESNGDESSQDSGVGLEGLELSTRVNETNSLDRWFREERRRNAMPLKRSMSVPSSVESPVIPNRLTNALKKYNAQTLLSPVRDVDDGFAELNEVDNELLLLEEMNSQLAASEKSVGLQLLVNRKRRYAPHALDEHEKLRASNKLRRNIVSSDSISRELSPPSGKENDESFTPTSSKFAAKQLSSGGVLSTKSSRRLVRCNSEAVIRSALSSCEDHHNLVGDFSRPYRLPVVTSGKHQDLKSISAETMAMVLNEQISSVSNYVIVDCRYPYEFDGGHLAGAKNIYTKEGIVDEFLRVDKKALKSESVQEQKIIIFHCEFSSERGPKLMRFLRNKDRDSHRDCYPALHYPECYLLEGGYRAFFETHGHLCEPRGYRQMVDPKHAADLKHFRSKSRSLPVTSTEEPSRQRRARSCLKL